jgi:hypothetical protein
VVVLLGDFVRPEALAGIEGVSHRLNLGHIGRL